MRHPLVRKAGLAAVAIAITAGSVAAVVASSADTVVNSARGHATHSNK